MRKSFRSQRGQALVLGLALAFAGTLGLFFLFSAGQVVATKQRLTNAADAAAWSAATWRARVLNFHAYSNRAIVAQEVAVAQAVTLASWSQYFETFVQNASVLAAAYPPLEPVLATASSIATRSREAAQWAAAEEVRWRAGTDVGYASLLQRSQELMNLSAGVFGMGAVANEVARANDRRFFAFALSDGGEFERLTRRYESPEDRQRLKGVVTDSLDRFTRGPRNEDQRLLLLPSSCFAGSTDFDKWFHWYRKRGGTEMNPDLERWEAADTGSLHDWRRRRFFGSCRDRESIPMGWGAAEAADPETMGMLTGNPGNVWDNASAASLASAGIASGGGLGTYAGIERVRELDYARLPDSRFPVSRVAVLARVEGDDTRTANRLNAGTGRLRLFEGFAKDRVWALSAAEVYFRRPPAASRRIEYASLYNPYWQARLAEPTAAQRAAADAHAR